MTDPGPTDGPPTRVNFLPGHLLRAEDLRAEQDYHRRMRYLHNRLLHGQGIAEGFSVDPVPGGLQVSPGMAIDPLGRELLLPESARLDLPPEAGAQEETTWWVTATWEEVPSAPVVQGGGTEFTRWVERCGLVIGPDAPYDAGPAVLIATVVAVAGNVASIDTSRRRQLGVT